MRIKITFSTLVLCTIILSISVFIVGCTNKEKQHEILIAAAASMEPVLKEIEELYIKENPGVDLNFTFASSGALEQQIRQGAPVDVFISASQNQMKSLLEDDFIMKETRIDLLENKLVLITPINSKLQISGFEDITRAKMIAIGDPNSVPAGQYAKEVLEYLSIYKEVSQKTTFGKDVTEVLTWVSSGNAEVGIAYKTDTIFQEKVKIIAEAPEGSHSKIIYSVAVIRNTKKVTLANDFLLFLQTKEVMKLYEKYGFQHIAFK